MGTVFAPHGPAVLKRNVSQGAVAGAFFTGDASVRGMKLPGVHEQSVIECTYDICKGKFPDKRF